MQIECPACAVRYDVPDEVVRPGRAMRCARCGETWTPRVDAPATVPGAAAPATVPGAAASAMVPEAAALDMRPDAARPAGEDWVEPETDAPEERVPLLPAPATGGRVTLLVAAWIGSAVVLLAAVWAIWHVHHRIERSWPPSARLFATFEHRHR